MKPNVHLGTTSHKDDRYSREIITRGEAERRGMKQYWTGKPCRNGHESPRYTGTGMCTDCAKGHFKKWRLKNLDRDRANSKKWQKDNPAPIRMALAKNRARRYRRVAKWADKSAILWWYHLAEQCTLATGVLHVVDHIVPLNGYYVSGLHVENNLQVIPNDMNRKKGNRHIDVGC